MLYAFRTGENCTVFAPLAKPLTIKREPEGSLVVDTEMVGRDGFEPT